MKKLILNNIVVLDSCYSIYIYKHNIDSGGVFSLIWVFLKGLQDQL